MKTDILDDQLPEDYYLEEVNEVYMCLTTTEKHGEGLVYACDSNGSILPLMATDITRLSLITPLAEDIASHTGCEIKVIKFSNREIISVIKER